MPRVVIVGGGIAGLTAAYRMSGTPGVTLVEARDRLGGTIVTERREGFLVEGGPDSFIVQKPWALELCRELGLERELIPTARRKVYVFSRGRLHPLPEGMMLTVPTRILPMLTSGLISFGGKLRMALDLVLPRGAPAEDESLAAFVRRRFGSEALVKIAEPLMAGIFVAPAERLSLRSTFPRMLEMEREHRSLIRAMRRIPSTGESPFRALRGGMDRLVSVLRDRLGETEVVSNAPAREVRRAGSGKWRVELDSRGIEADHVILACPAPAAAALVREDLPELSRAIGAIPYVSTATISLAYRGVPDLDRLDATGFVIPRPENRRILACTWTSRKFDGRAPDGDLLVRCFAGGDGREDLLGLSDDELVRIAREEMSDTMELRAEPAFARVFRWPATNPIYEVGHLERVRAIDAMLSEAPGIHVTGSGYRGVGIPDCVRDATRAAEKILGE